MISSCLKFLRIIKLALSARRVWDFDRTATFPILTFTAWLMAENRWDKIYQYSSTKKKSCLSDYPARGLHVNANWKRRCDTKKMCKACFTIPSLHYYYQDIAITSHLLIDRILSEICTMLTSLIHFESQLVGDLP